MFTFDHNSRLHFIFADKVLHCTTNVPAEVISLLKSCLIKCSKSLIAHNKEWCDRRIHKSKWHMINLRKITASRTKPPCTLPKGEHICKFIMLIKCRLSFVSKKLMAIFMKLWSYQTVVKNRPKSLQPSCSLTPYSQVDLLKAWE